MWHGNRYPANPRYAHMTPHDRATTTPARALTTLAAIALILTLVPTTQAGLGPYGADGWPVNIHGESVNPFNPHHHEGTLQPGPDANLAAFPTHHWGHHAATSESQQPPLNRVGDVTAYPYWPLLTAEMIRLATDHPDTVKLYTAGKSTLGLDLYMLEIADFARLESGGGTPLESREVVWIDGGTHSNEYSGVYFALAWAQFLLDEYETNDTARWIVDNRHTWIMPMVNPDGSNAFGRLNANLVNINRNYPVVWDGVGNDALMNNRGPTPASEIETQINIAWFNKTQPDYYASIHCCGNLWLYPYGEEGVNPPDQEMLQRVCDEAFPDVREDCGPIWSTIYPASGSSVDTAYEYTGAVAFGYEMSGRGAISIWGQPLTFQDVMTQEIESWNGILHAFQNVHLYGAHPEVVLLEQKGRTVTALVQNTGYGNLTNGTLVLKENDGHLQAIDLPFLAPGQLAPITLDAPRATGEAELHLHYQKRIMATPEGITILPVWVQDATKPDEVPPEGVVAVLFASADRSDAEAVGLAPALILVGLLAAVAVARRKP